MTRTIFIGSPSIEETVLYNRVLYAQTETVNLVRAGITTQQLDEHCRTLLETELSNQFIHSLGHGLGSQVHEWPSVSGKQAITLQENMVVTIEPGVYSAEQYGIRIEDDVLITEIGADVLTQTSKQLVTVNS